MIRAIRPLLAFLLIAGATSAHAADSFSTDTSSAEPIGATAMPLAQGTAALDLIRAGGWSIGISGVRAERGLNDAGQPGMRTRAGYRRTFGGIELDAGIDYTSYPGARRTSSGASYDHAGFSTGLRYGPLSARYDRPLARGLSGVGGGDGLFDWRDLKAGLSRRLEGGWRVALNYTRAYGAAGPDDRAAVAGLRLDGRPACLSAGRRALVLSAARSF